jgi:Zinc carboxypeptidase
MNRTRIAGLAGLALAVSLAPAHAQDEAHPLQPVAEVPAPRFDRLYTFPEHEAFMRGYAAAYPDWVRLEQIGSSGQGRGMWLLTITNPDSGDEHAKPAIYVDANIHANEVQGAEVTLYLVDFLLRNYGRLDRVTELLDRVVFYVLPVVNPDGRTGWFEGPATAHFPRTVMVPVDDDRDGLADEDGFDDLNGDGLITMMRKQVPLGEGHYRLDPDDRRRLVPVEADELGDWIQLGFEGFDNDGDGQVNEDPVGYVDPNRTFGFDWQPRYVQGGAGDYPLQIPETRAIAEWALAHENVGACQSFHNAGRMILRGPGSEDAPAYPRADVAAYDLIAEEGERLLPGYRSLVVHEDLYTVHGSTVDHFYMIHGAISFTNELYSPLMDTDGDGQTSADERMDFNDLLTLGRQFVDWTPYEHPDYGPIEVGGYRHDVGRVPETWALVEECHRNAAFVLYHAWQLPKLSLGEPIVTHLGGDTWRLDVPVLNERAIPSVTAIARQNGLHRPDVATVEGATVLAAGVIEDTLQDRVTLQDDRPGRLLVDGIPGYGTRRLMFVVEGQGEARVTYDSLKGGRLQLDVALRED